MPKVLNYRVIIEQDEDGVFVASVPALQGCYTEGDSFEEVLKNAEDVIRLHLQARKEKGVLPDDSSTEFVGVKDLSKTGKAAVMLFLPTPMADGLRSLSTAKQLARDCLESN